MVWATRLASFLLFHVLKAGSNTQFDEIRSHFFKFLQFLIGVFFDMLYIFSSSEHIYRSNSLGM